MRKNYFKMIFALMCMLTTSIAASAQCYILGSDGVWNPTKASATLEATSEEGVYQGEVEFTDSWFCIVTQLSSSSDDWATINANRYAGSYNNDPVTVNTAKAFHKVDDGSFYLAALGTYTVTVNFNDSTILLYDSSYVGPDVPTTAYVIGNDGSWNTDAASLTLTATSEAGVFTGEMTVTDTGSGYGYFTIASQLTDAANDWTTLMTYRYGPATANTELVAGVEGTMVYGIDTSWMIAAGTYTLTVDFKDNSILATSTETGITTVLSARTSDKYYDLNGRCLNTAPSKGLYIFNGKKYIAK